MQVSTVLVSVWQSGHELLQGVTGYSRSQQELQLAAGYRSQYFGCADIQTSTSHMLQQSNSKAFDHEKALGRGVQVFMS